MKKIIVSFFLFFVFSSFGQTVVKANITTVLGYPQIGLETTLGKKTTFQIDALTSLWKSFNGGPQQILMVVPEFRYYPKKALEGFYFGVHVGGSKYKFQKWNYINTDYYQQGYSLLYGVTVGYQVKLSERFSLDAFLGGGFQQGYYKGYLLSSGERYDIATKYNKSGEVIPYRGGLMVVYKLGSKNER